MSVFAAALNALNLRHDDAVQLLGPGGRVLKASTVADWSRGKTRVPGPVWQRLSELFEQVEACADEIIAEQGALDGDGLGGFHVDVARLPLAHPKLRAAAAARALLVIGPQLMTVADERPWRA